MGRNAGFGPKVRFQAEPFTAPSVDTEGRNWMKAGRPGCSCLGAGTGWRRCQGLPCDQLVRALNTRQHLYCESCWDLLIESDPKLASPCIVGLEGAWVPQVEFVLISTLLTHSRREEQTDNVHTKCP